MIHKAFVLLSGGLDSTTCLYKALVDWTPPEAKEDTPAPWIEAISINYGQRHRKEMEYAERTCDDLGITHTIVELKDILGGAMLTDPSKEIPNVSYADLPHGVSPTYVPFRNGTMLSLITAHAQKWVNADAGQTESIALKEHRRSASIYFGAHAEDAQNWAYPDCTPEFIGAMANAIYIGSYRAIRLVTPLQWLVKSEIIKLGTSLCVPFEKTWSCYAGGEKHCGVCPTCRSRRQGFIDAGIHDPTEYAS